MTPWSRGQWLPFDGAATQVQLTRVVQYPFLSEMGTESAWHRPRIENEVRYSEAPQQVIGSGRYEVPYGRAAWAASGPTGYAGSATLRCLRWAAKKSAQD